MQYSFIAIDLWRLEKEQVASKGMLSRYQPFSVRCKQTNTSLKILASDNDKGCIAG